MFRVQRGSDPIMFEITGWTAKEKTGSYRGTLVKIIALTTFIFITKGEINYQCIDSHVQNVSLVPRLPYTVGDSSRKPRHDRRCDFDYTIEFRFNHVISRIYIDISESGN